MADLRCFDRPDAGSTIDATRFAELEPAWAQLDADPDVRVIVNTGNGGGFQAGLDMRQLARDPDGLGEQSRRTKRGELKPTAWRNRVWRPVIALVNGGGAGGACPTPPGADIVLLSSDAWLLDPHVSVGQVGVYETIGLVRKTAMESVARMAPTGRDKPIDAGRVYQLGICSQLVDPRGDDQNTLGAGRSRAGTKGGRQDG